MSDQELFGGPDSGFNSVDSGSKRWSGNEASPDPGAVVAQQFSACLPLS